jgi:glycosyltransferase involved in cell wall biosynthesis
MTTILQILPALISGGVERGTIDQAVYLQQQGCTSLIASAGGPMTAELLRTRIEHITLPLNSKNPLQILDNANALLKVIRERKVDLIHARSRAPAWAAYRAAKAAGIPLVTSFHGTYGLQNKFKRWYNGVMVRGERVIAVSNFIRQHIKQNYPIPAERITVVPRGIDLVRFDPARTHQERIIDLARNWRLPDDRPIIMLPGRISRWKGQAELLHALTQLGHDKFHCILVGSSHGHEAYQRQLEKLIIELGLAGRVQWVGECRDMPAAYMLADVVVSASIEPEAFGRVVVEAQAMGRPVLATNHGGSAETVIDNETGYLCTATIDGVFRGLKRVLALNAQARLRLGEASIAHIRAHYTKEKMCAGEYAVYQEVLAAHAEKSTTAAQAA